MATQHPQGIRTSIQHLQETQTQGRLEELMASTEDQGGEEGEDQEVRLLRSFQNVTSSETFEQFAF